MKKLFVILFSTFYFFQTTYTQTPLTSAQWREDVQFLKTIVHNKYKNLFHNITSEQFDEAVATLDKQIPDLRDYEIAAEISKIVALFRIGHTNMWLFPEQKPHTSGIAAALNFRIAPVSFYDFSDGLYIKAADKKYAPAVGYKVLKIGLLDTKKALEAIRPFVPYENEQGFKNNMTFYLTIFEVLKTAKIIDQLEYLPIVVLKNGKEETVRFEPTPLSKDRFSPTGLTIPEGWVDANTAIEKPLWMQQPKEYRNMVFLEASKILYVRHSLTLNDGEKTIKDFFQKVSDFVDKNDVERLILDVRMNGGGNNYLNKPIIMSIIQARKINQKGKFYCIIGRRSFSACQNLVNELDKYTEVTFVGEPTSETVNFYGDTKQETLPNSKLTVSLSWLWWQNLDPRDKRLWTAPHIAADMCFMDYIAGKDPALEAILNDTSTTTVSLTEKLTQFALQDKAAEALQFAKDHIKKPQNHYYADRFQADINVAGYRLMNKEKFQAAYILFDINTQLYPESADVYDSKAEILWALGKKEDAINFYEMAIRKDPNGEAGDNAKRQIEKIKSN